MLSPSRSGLELAGVFLQIRFDVLDLAPALDAARKHEVLRRAPPWQPVNRLDRADRLRLEQQRLDGTRDLDGGDLPRRGARRRQPRVDHRGELDRVSVIAASARDGGEESIAGGGGERD